MSYFACVLSICPSQMSQEVKKLDILSLIQIYKDIWGQSSLLKERFNFTLYMELNLFCLFGCLFFSLLRHGTFSNLWLNLHLVHRKAEFTHSTLQEVLTANMTWFGDFSLIVTLHSISHRFILQVFKLNWQKLDEYVREPECFCSLL